MNKENIFPLNHNQQLTIGISTRALFDLEKENEIFENEGSSAYVDYMISHEEDILSPGDAFALIKALLALTKPDGEPLCKVVIISKNSAQSSLRIFNSIEYYGLNITQAALTTGNNVAPYFKAYGIDLFLSANESDVKEALAGGIAAATLIHTESLNNRVLSQIKIAFDGDCVLFSDEAEKIFQSKGIEAFSLNEKEKANQPLEKGPFANLLATISLIQTMYKDEEQVPIKTALITARSIPAHKRVLKTLRAWNVRIDEAHFLGGTEKTEIIKAFGAHIFFDDNEENLRLASTVVLSAKVPNSLATESA